MNRTHILTANKTWQILVNCLLKLIYVFKYPTTVIIIKYDDILFYVYILYAGCQSIISIRRAQIATSSGTNVEHLLLNVYEYFLNVYLALSWIANILNVI